MKIAISQSNYIPWKGYFDLIASVDEFVLYDQMQFTKRDWRNRNLIKTSKGLHWLTIPVKTKGKYHQKISEVKIENESWKSKHLMTILNNYSKALYFKEIKDFLSDLYQGCNYVYLSEINYHFITSICNFLKINTSISWDHEYALEEGKTERLIGICKQLNANEYLTGPRAKDYIEVSKFKNAGIELKYKDYRNYKEYSQPFPPFVHKVSIIDLILNTGFNSLKYFRNV